MSSTTDKAKGYANEAVGKAKEGIGRATGNENLEAEGDAQQIKGTCRSASARSRTLPRKAPRPSTRR